MDLYQHLVEVVNHIVMHCPDKGLDQFEEISYLIKHKDNFKMEEFLRIHEADNYNTPSAAFKESVEKYAALAKKHFEVSSQYISKGEVINFCRANSQRRPTRVKRVEHQ